jgi:Tol biopolymer transport system component
VQFAPNGDLVYATGCDGPNAEIYAVEPDGSGLRQLVQSGSNDFAPSVSPDGSQIVFVRSDSFSCHGCDETLWLMKADGTGLRSFPNGDTDPAYDNSPSFSPDGKTILFTRQSTQSTGLFTVPVAGGSAKPLRIAGSASAWGPTQIAYDAVSGAATTATASGAGKHVVASNEAIAFAWSADGRLAMLEQPGNTPFILIVGTGKRIPLPGFGPAPLDAGGLAWSPDANAFAFVAESKSDPTGDVYEIDIDGTHLTQVTHGFGAVGALSWR